MLSGSFEDELDFFAESVNRTSALNFRMLFGRKKTYVPDRKRNIILHQNIVIISVCDRGDLRLTPGHAESGLWRRTRHRCGRL
jgi:hypothetical protein